MLCFPMGCERVERPEAAGLYSRIPSGVSILTSADLSSIPNLKAI